MILRKDHETDSDNTNCGYSIFALYKFFFFIISKKY